MGSISACAEPSGAIWCVGRAVQLLNWLPSGRPWPLTEGVPRHLTASGGGPSLSTSPWDRDLWDLTTRNRKSWPRPIFSRPKRAPDLRTRFFLKNQKYSFFPLRKTSPQVRPAPSCLGGSADACERLWTSLLPSVGHPDTPHGGLSRSQVRRLAHVECLPERPGGCNWEDFPSEHTFSEGRREVFEHISGHTHWALTTHPLQLQHTYCNYYFAHVAFTPRRKNPHGFACMLRLDMMFWICAFGNQKNIIQRGHAKSRGPDNEQRT